MCEEVESIKPTFTVIYSINPETKEITIESAHKSGAPMNIYFRHFKNKADLDIEVSHEIIHQAVKQKYPELF